MRMRAGHLIYKVADLELAVKEWRDKGFVVEYGRTKNPYNAIIYFSEGPYIELLAGTGMPVIVKKILSLLGKRKAIERFDYLDSAPEGWVDFCIEKNPGSLDEEIAYLNERGIKGFYLKKGKRVDTKQRELRYKCFFPEERGCPFLMSYFTVDPRPKNFTHPNGIKRVGQITFTTTKALAGLIESILDDSTVTIVAGGSKGQVTSVSFS